MEIDKTLRHIWQNRVDSQYLFRGMSIKDLSDILNPESDPFKDIRPKLLELLDILQKLVDIGFQFRLCEEHFGNVCWHELSNIIVWTRRDLENGGIDFTSDYTSAKEYSDCFQGSQLKQNLKYITDNLPSRKGDSILQTNMTEKQWSLVSDINTWVSEKSSEHKSIVIWVRRSCPAFNSCDRCLLVGQYESFSRGVITALNKAGLPYTIESINKLVPAENKEFCFRLRDKLNKKDIERIEYMIEQKTPSNQLIVGS